MTVETVQGAISVLIQAVELAQQKGVYSFGDSRLIADAIDFLVPQKQQESETTVDTETTQL